MDQEAGVSGVLLIAIFGFGIALGLFLITFITSQRARIHPQSNLRISLISPPPRPTLPPRARTIPLLPSPEATTEAELASPLLEEIPVTVPEEVTEEL